MKNGVLEAATVWTTEDAFMKTVPVRSMSAKKAGLAIVAATEVTELNLLQTLKGMHYLLALNNE